MSLSGHVTVSLIVHRFLSCHKGAMFFSQKALCKSPNKTFKTGSFGSIFFTCYLLSCLLFTGLKVKQMENLVLSQITLVDIASLMVVVKFHLLIKVNKYVKQVPNLSLVRKYWYLRNNGAYHTKYLYKKTNTGCDLLRHVLNLEILITRHCM